MSIKRPRGPAASESHPVLSKTCARVGSPPPRHPSVNKCRIPEHVAIIMDGNGRWAKKRGLPRVMGHKQGAQNVTNIVEAASKLGIKYLTLFTFSVENWRRPQTEINALMNLFEQVLSEKLPGLIKNNVKLNLIGDLSAIRKSTCHKFEEAIQKTSQNSGLILTIALNYSGRDDIIRAINRIISDGIKSVDEETFSSYLDTAKLPDPELIVRTSGEARISNFLLWQIAYSEVYFSETLWPDFTEKDLDDAVKDFQNRDRRFGGV